MWQTASIRKIGIDGVILTKLDGDTRGGAALSIKATCGKPILYVGMGEKLSDLEQFYPDRMASRILGMGDVMTLIEKAQANIDEEQSQRNGAEAEESTVWFRRLSGEHEPDEKYGRHVQYLEYDAGYVAVKLQADRGCDG